MIDQDKLERFIFQSNEIEGIHKMVTIEVPAYLKFLSAQFIGIKELVEFVSWVQPDAQFRNDSSIGNVRIGRHHPIKSGQAVEAELITILHNASISHCPFDIHRQYESLHPFTDGNGRSGRALWLWQMINQKGYDMELLFLHKYYYQSLEVFR